MQFSALPKNYIVINSTKTMKYNRERGRDSQSVTYGDGEYNNSIEKFTRGFPQLT